MTSETPYFRPATGWAGDVTPFCRDGVFHLFYLKELRDEPYDSSRELAHAPDSRLSFHHVTTTDFVDFHDHGVAIPAGGPADADLSAGTGSILEHDGMFHFFYSGMNPTSPFPQVQLVATSPDLFTWVKDPAFCLRPVEPYERGDFRDPFVFRDPARGDFVMLLAARVPGPPWHRRGVTAIARSTDLREWDFHPPVYAPGRFHMHECPDLFEFRGTWYLIFSEFSSGMQTRYRTAPSPLGPFDEPPVDTFDTRAFYAAKSVSDGDRRYLIGWIPSRSESGEWLWGGQLTAWEIVVTPEGALAPAPIRGAAEAMGAPVTIDLRAVYGTWEFTSDGAIAEGASSYAAVTWATVGARWATSLRMSIQGSGGLVIGSDAAMSSGIEIRIEGNDLVLDAFPRRGDAGYLARRPIIGHGDTHDLTVMRDGDVLQVVSAGRAAATTRVELPASTVLGAFVASGYVRLEGVKVWG
ncbi:MAG: hypothetical protein KF727_10310 [Microbacteriaceae bacterium]|nr:hypothetical protein [Microbacteriaceae bacterium]